MNPHDFVREDLHEFPLHLQAKLKDYVQRAHAEGFASGAESVLAAARETGEAEKPKTVPPPRTSTRPKASDR